MSPGSRSAWVGCLVLVMVAATVAAALLLALVWVIESSGGA